VKKNDEGLQARIALVQSVSRCFTLQEMLQLSLGYRCQVQCVHITVIVGHILPSLGHILYLYSIQS
jgi:hypothetical protein